ncbi:MAG: Addiction module toxin, RelE/StbE family [Candidatus Daviesbacteria bacterium GW2011_GWA1_41_61]|nr:MAG: Addiction module toxin, RelE/StbE family [Candidatus Daviesbacteria bacterium GW2011_GWB1_41_15]KKS14558.1 MAG: Addiction module toxin, RelE/StbE family [Candidatus Daviesbacteria bacterium GW2011_GWA1_41_61]
MYRIKLTAKAKRELRKLSQTDKLRIAEIIEELKEDPLIGKPLSRELIKKFSYRIGVYRVIYRINRQDKIIVILSAGHRGTVYN